MTLSSAWGKIQGDLGEMILIMFIIGTTDVVKRDFVIKIEIAVRTEIPMGGYTISDSAGVSSS